MAAGVGLILGLILDLAIGWTWWAAAVGFVFLVWLFFLTSALRGPRIDIGHQLLRVINPERAATRDIQRLEDALTSGSLAGYDVMNWEGEKSIGGWGGAPIPRSLTIRHGDFEGEAEWVEVTTHMGDAADTAGDWLQDELERRLLQSQFPPPDDLTVEDFHRWHEQRQRAIENAEPPDWQPALLRVEDEQLPGQIARAGGHWVAYFKTGAVVVDLIGNGVDPNEVQLAPIITLDPYTKKSA
jgi:hypothetical protein